MNKLFIDTSAFFALSNSADQWHDAAVHVMASLSPKVQLTTTNFILDEVVTRLRCKMGHRIAVVFGEEVLKNKKIKVTTVDRAIEKEAWAILKKYHDQKFSYTDCTSFACIKKQQIQHVFAFDNDFRVMGFSLQPS